MRPLLDVVVRPWEDHRLWVVMCLHIQSGIDTSPKWLALTETLERHPMRCLKTYGLYHLYMAYHLLAACCQNHTFVACEALSITSLAGFPRAQKLSALSTLHKSSLQTLSKASEYSLPIKRHTQPCPAHLHIQ